jgi:hypothetical protein
MKWNFHHCTPICLGGSWWIVSKFMIRQSRNDHIQITCLLTLLIYIVRKHQVANPERDCFITNPNNPRWSTWFYFWSWRHKLLECSPEFIQRLRKIKSTKALDGKNGEAITQSTCHLVFSHNMIFGSWLSDALRLHCIPKIFWFCWVP